MLSVATTSPAGAQEDPTAYMVTYIEVVPAAKNQGATIIKALAEASRKEAGVTRFEVFERTAPASVARTSSPGWRPTQATAACVAPCVRTARLLPTCSTAPVAAVRLPLSSCACTR